MALIPLLARPTASSAQGAGAPGPDPLQVYDPLRVSMRPISFDPLSTDPRIVPGTETWIITVESTTGDDYALLQLSSNFVPPGWSGQLQALGATVVAVIPPAAYLLRLPSESVPLLGGLPLARWADGYLPGYRVPPEIKGAATAIPPGESLAISLILFKGEDPDAYLASLSILVPGIVIDEVYEPGPSEPWSSPRVEVRIPAISLPGALQSLAGIEALHVMDLRLKPILANDDKLTWLQSGVADNAAPKILDSVPPATVINAPAFKAGIIGLGETIAVCDTGLENDMCFFRWGPRTDPSCMTEGFFLDPPQVLDPSNPVHAPFFKPANKVVAYYFHQGFQHPLQRYDSFGSLFHGTHVAGTAAGDAFDDVASTPEFLAKDDDVMTVDSVDDASSGFAHFIDHHQAGDGMAPGAQLLIQDVRDENNPTDLEGLGRATFAERHAQAYFTPAPVSVRHHTNSWGWLPTEPPPTPIRYFESENSGDAFSWAHRDFNLFFCGGNIPPGSSDPPGLPARGWGPSNMKNCVSVGNSANPKNSPGFGMAMHDTSQRGPAVGMRLKPDLSAPGHQTRSATPPCESPTAGPFANSCDGGAETGNCTDDIDNDGDTLTDCEDLNCESDPACAACDTDMLTGTSQATPAVAGLAALLRQYIREGRYPDGVPDAARGFSPTSALIKALLVNSTRSLWIGDAGNGRGTADFIPLGSLPQNARGYRPTMSQGWGRPVLDDIIDFGPTDPPPSGPPNAIGERERSNMLILTDTPNGLRTLETNDGRREALEDFHAAIHLGQTHEFSFVVTAADEPMHVTLAWTDVPGAVNAADPLVNDLDLELIDPLGRVWRPEPGSPPDWQDAGGAWHTFGNAPRLWETGFSKLGAEAGTAQSSQWPFYQFFTERDERNNVENIFVRPAFLGAVDPVVTGVWQARVIFYNGPAVADTQEMKVYPDLVTEGPPPNLPCDAGTNRPCDWANTAHQGYALVVSGAVANVTTVPGFAGFRVWDGCLPDTGNQMVDIREFVDMDIDFVYDGIYRSNVVADVSTSAVGVDFGVRDYKGSAGIDAGATTRSSLGDITSGLHAARVMWAWRPELDGLPPDTCVPTRYPTGIPFTVRLFEDDDPLPFMEFGFLMDRGASPCFSPPPANWPYPHPEPVPPLAAGGDPTFVVDWAHSVCGSQGQVSVIFSWAPIPHATRYNMYRGTLADLLAGRFDHVAHPDPDPIENAGFCNEEALFDFYPPGGDGRLDYCDADESGPAYYYWITGERDCPLSIPPTGLPGFLRGIEGSVGKSSSDVEYPVGTGCR